MSAHDFLKVHHMRRRPGTNQVVLHREDPYILIVAQGQPNCYLRAGKAWSEEGTEFDTIPPHVIDQMRRIPAKRLKKFGFSSVPDGEPNASQAKPVEEITFERGDTDNEAEASEEAGQALTEQEERPRRRR